MISASRLAPAAFLFFVTAPVRADVTVYFGPPALEGSGVIPGEGSTVIPPERSTVIPASDARPDRPAPEPTASEPPAPAPRMERADAEEPVEGRPVAREETTPDETVAAPAPAAMPAPSEPAPPAATPAPVETASEPAARPIVRSCEPVEIVRVGDGSGEHRRLALVGCDGTIDPESLRELSILARPSRVDRPSATELAEHETDERWVAPGVRRLDPGLLERVRTIADRFPGHAIEIVSGYRPDARDGSRHRLGRAIDLRVAGVAVADLDAFVRTIDATGVGLYPTTEFVHVDVRGRSAHWIDVSGPGEPPQLVAEAPASEATATEAPAAAERASRGRTGRATAGIGPTEPTSIEPTEPATATASLAPTEPATASLEPTEPATARAEPADESEIDPTEVGRAAAALLDGFTLTIR